MSHYTPRGLLCAFETNGPAVFTAKRKRPRGAKGLGVKFERELAKALGTRALHGQWFQFHDSKGRHFCQTDFLIFAREAVYCLESKLGNIEAGRAQFSELYKPILEYVYRRPAHGIIVARHITQDPTGVCTSLEEAAFQARLGLLPTLQWRERLPLCIPGALGPQWRPQRGQSLLSP